MPSSWINPRSKEANFWLILSTASNALINLGGRRCGCLGLRGRGNRGQLRFSTSISWSFPNFSVHAVTSLLSSVKKPLRRRRNRFWHPSFPLCLRWCFRNLRSWPLRTRSAANFSASRLKLANCRVLIAARRGAKLTVADDAAASPSTLPTTHVRIIQR